MASESGISEDEFAAAMKVGKSVEDVAKKEESPLYRGAQSGAKGGDLAKARLCSIKA